MSTCPGHDLVSTSELELQAWVLPNRLWHPNLGPKPCPGDVLHHLGPRRGPDRGATRLRLLRGIADYRRRSLDPTPAASSAMAPPAVPPALAIAQAKHVPVNVPPTSGDILEAARAMHQQMQTQNLQENTGSEDEAGWLVPLATRLGRHTASSQPAALGQLVGVIVL